jgi:hypothetical protein
MSGCPRWVAILSFWGETVRKARTAHVKEYKNNQYQPLALCVTDPHASTCIKPRSLRRGAHSRSWAKRGHCGTTRRAQRIQHCSAPIQILLAKNTSICHPLIPPAKNKSLRSLSPTPLSARLENTTAKCVHLTSYSTQEPQFDFHTPQDPSDYHPAPSHTRSHPLIPRASLP